MQRRLPCFTLVFVLMVTIASMSVAPHSATSDSSGTDSKVSRKMGLLAAQDEKNTYNASVVSGAMETATRNRELASSDFNPIDACWRGDKKWADNRMKLANCGLGFGGATTGGKGGAIYVVTNNSDDAQNPTKGTLRYGVIQKEPLWITFQKDMSIVLQKELLVASDKTIDGRGAKVHIANGPCITIYEVSNVIIHNINIHDCVVAKAGLVRTSPSKLTSRGSSDGDAISVFHSKNIWIDHNSLASSYDGLIDVVHASTNVTISNNYFSNHNKVMLLGHDDSYSDDKDMNVTVIYNHFGPGLVQRMPRCRYGLVHVIRNDYTDGWGLYAIGGSAHPTILSVGNRFNAPSSADRKEVTKRMDTAEADWKSWIWRSEEDTFLNGAYFTQSGAPIGTKNYGLPSSSVLTAPITGSAGPLSCSVGTAC